jgi:sugar phosphate isomerase/epimerase
MKLGVAGLLPAWQTIDLAAARRVREAGFRGAQWFFPNPLVVDMADVRRVQRAFEDADLEICQVNGTYEALVNPDEALRTLGIQGLSALARLGGFLRTPSVYVRPGGLNPRGHWYPHPDNHLQQTFARLVDSLKQACRVAEDEGVILAVEGHVLSPLDSPQRMRDVLDAVDSPALKVNIDPVNFIGTVRGVHNPRPVVEELLDLLSADTIAAHLKDLALSDALVVHIDEVLLGTGTLDYAWLLLQLQERCPQIYCLIEHLPDEQVPQARANLMRVANQVGVKLDE